MKRKGFSLIEIILVMLIIVILSIVIYTVYKKNQTDTKVNNMLTTIDTIYASTNDLTKITGGKDVDFQSIRSYINSSNPGLIDEDGTVESLNNSKIYYLASSSTNSLYISLESTDASVCNQLFNKIQAHYGSVIVPNNQNTNIAKKLSNSEIGSYCARSGLNGAYIMINSYKDSKNM